MGSSGSGSTTTTSSNSVPAWLKPFYQTAEQDFASGTSGLPNFNSMYQNFPLQGTPPLTSNQLADIAGFQNMSGGPNAEQTAAANNLAYLADPNSAGYTAATQAAEKEFQNQQLPQIENQAALMGQGNSGAALEAASMGQEAALVPLLQQQQQSQLSAAGQQAGLGSTEYQQQVTQLTNALQAAGLPYQVAEQQAQNLYNQQSGQESLAYGLETLPLSQLGSVFGKGTSVSTSSAPKF